MPLAASTTALLSLSLSSKLFLGFLLLTLYLLPAYCFPFYLLQPLSFSSPPVSSLFSSHYAHLLLYSSWLNLFANFFTLSPSELWQMLLDPIFGLAPVAFQPASWDDDKEETPAPLTSISLPDLKLHGANTPVFISTCLAFSLSQAFTAKGTGIQGLKSTTSPPSLHQLVQQQTVSVCASTLLAPKITFPI